MACTTLILPFDIFSGVCGELESEVIVGAPVQRGQYSWCHVEHLASKPGMTMDQPNQSSPSNSCVSVEKWIHELRQALLSQHNPNVKIRISQCTGPSHGRGCSGSNEGATESLERPEGVPSLTRGEWTGRNGIAGSDEGSTESLDRPERSPSPTLGEWTRGNRIAGSDKGSTESLERPERFPAPTPGELTGAHASSPLNLNVLLVCSLFLVYLYFLPYS